MILVVIPIKLRREAQLPQVARALDALRSGFALAERRQEQRGEDADDREHDQQFNQRERAAPSLGLSTFYYSLHGRSARTR